MIEPRGRQREVVYLPSEGHSVVLGSAGSGKSTSAVLRARYLGDERLDHGGPVLLLTFTRGLAGYVRELTGPVGSSIEVLTMHEAYRQPLRQAGRKDLYQLMTMRSAQGEAIRRFKARVGDHRLARRPVKFFREEFAWMGGHGIQDPDAYFDVERLGRGDARLLREDRELLFGAYSEYLEIRQERGFDFDLDDVALCLRLAAEAGEVDWPYRHTVIDEAQDFAPEVLRAAATATPADGSVTVFADYAQQVYGARMSWRAAGLSVPRVWELRGNHRNSHEIASVAGAIAAHPAFVSSDSFATSTGCDDGPVPRLTRVASLEEAEDHIVRSAERLSWEGSVAVLVCGGLDARAMQRVLPKGTRFLDRSLEGFASGGTFVGKMHYSKGFEFDSVILAICSDEYLPGQSEIEFRGLGEATSRALKALYVGVTRARRNLEIVYTGKVSPLIPADPGLFEHRGSP